MENSVQPNAWNCSICLDVMDGKNDKLVATSKRCLHIFHEVCIKDWINEGANTCPLCKLQDLHVEEILINQEHPKQYSKWNEDKENYTYQKAFDEEYPLNDPDREKLDPKDVLIQKELRGLERRETLSMVESLNYMSETLRQAKSNRYKKATFEKFVIHALRAQDLALENLGKEYRFENLLCSYEQKITALRSKAGDVFYRSYRNENNLELMELANEFSKTVGILRKNFEDLGNEIRENIDQYSIEQIQEILNGIDIELDAIIDSQPKELKDALNAVSNDDTVVIQDHHPILDPKKRKEPNPDRKYLLVVSIAVLAISIFAIHKIYHSYDINNPQVI